MIPFWARRLCSNLDKLKIVYKYRCYYNRIVVYYRTGIRRVYIFRKSYRLYHRRVDITQPGSILKSRITIGHQYPRRPLEHNYDKELEKYFFVSRKILNNATFMQKEILIQELLQKIIANGTIKCKYTADDIKLELDKIRNCVPRCVYGSRIGRPIIETFFDVYSAPRNSKVDTELARVFQNARVLNYVLSNLVHKTKKDITINHLVGRCYNCGFGPSWPNPASYFMLFQQLDFRHRTLYDISPYMGSKAIACSIMDIRYAPNGEPWDYAINNGLLDVLNINLVKTEDIDVLLLDNNFKRLPQDIIDKYMAMRWNNAMLFVKACDLDVVKSKYPPKRIVNIMVDIISKKHDYIFAY